MRIPKNLGRPQKRPQMPKAPQNLSDPVEFFNQFMTKPKTRALELITSVSVDQIFPKGKEGEWEENKRRVLEKFGAKTSDVIAQAIVKKMEELYRLRIGKIVDSTEVDKLAEIEKTIRQIEDKIDEVRRGQVASEREVKEAMEGICDILLRAAKKGEITIVNGALKELAAGFGRKHNPQLQQEMIQKVISGLQEIGKFSLFFLRLAAEHFDLPLEEVGVDPNEKIIVKVVDERKKH